jgi:ABC-type sugar transport system, periplasmic component
MNKWNEMKKNRIVYLAAISSIAVGIIIIIIGMSYYNFRIAELKITDTSNYKEYKYHYAIISEEADEPFWEAIYRGALEKGKEQKVYVEKTGDHLSSVYSLQDLMKIAIASRVDGIIVEPNGEQNMEELINNADQAGIPVVTVLKDISGSKRKSFIGINSYNQGKAYAKQVLELVREGKHKVTVLLNSDNMDTDQSIIYSSILGEVNRKNVEVNTAVVNIQSTFSSEEDIRNIIMDTENPPDVLVCLTAVDTLCAYQAIVDYNRVGKTDIIGYYDSDMILQAIEKNIIHSTMTPDANQIGAYCVEALTEYRKTGRVSDYYSVDIRVINAENAEDDQKSKAGSKEE